MRLDLARLAWSSCSELVTALARHAGFETNALNHPGVGTHAGIEHACARLGLEAERVDLVGHHVCEQLRESAPAVTGENSAWAAVIRGNGGH